MCLFWLFSSLPVVVEQWFSVVGWSYSEDQKRLSCSKQNPRLQVLAPDYGCWLVVILSRWKVSQAPVGLPKISDLSAYICTLKIKRQLLILTTKLKPFSSETRRAVWQGVLLAEASVANTFPFEPYLPSQTCTCPSWGSGTVSYSQRGRQGFPNSGF